MKKKDKKRFNSKVKKRVENIEKEIKEEIFFNIPNSITILRLILTFIIVYMIFSGFSRLSIALVFSIAAISDWFDGFIARKFNQKTNIGARLDQVIDRIFTIIIVLSLAMYFLIYTHESIVILFMVTSREIVGLPGFIIRIVRNLDSYKVKYIGKITTFIQSLTIALIILGVNWSIYPAIATCILGIISGFDYLKDSTS